MKGFVAEPPFPGKHTFRPKSQAALSLTKSLPAPCCRKPFQPHKRFLGSDLHALGEVKGTCGHSTGRPRTGAAAGHLGVCRQGGGVLWDTPAVTVSICHPHRGLGPKVPRSKEDR